MNSLQFLGQNVTISSFLIEHGDQLKCFFGYERRLQQRFETEKQSVHRVLERASKESDNMGGESYIRSLKMVGRNQINRAIKEEIEEIAHEVVKQLMSDGVFSVTVPDILSHKSYKEYNAFLEGREWMSANYDVHYTKLKKLLFKVVAGILEEYLTILTLHDKFDSSEISQYSWEHSEQILSQLSESLDKKQSLISAFTDWPFNERIYEEAIRNNYADGDTCLTCARVIGIETFERIVIEAIATQSSNKAMLSNCIEKIDHYASPEKRGYISVMPVITENSNAMQSVDHGVQEVEADSVKNDSTETKKKVRTVLNMILELAVEEDIIRKNPVKSKSVKVKGKPSQETPPYSVEQMQYLLNHVNDIKKPMDRMYIVIHALHPLRPEEVFGLKWGNIDLTANEIHVQNTVTHPDRNQPLYKEMETKTDASRRTLKMVEWAKQYLVPGKPDEFVLGGLKPLSYQQIKKMRERIKKDIAFEEAITPCRFRTTVLTDIYAETKDINLTKSSAGHTTATMTLKYYAKGRETSDRAAAATASAYGLQPAT